ncbi:hypothetical protein CEXT_476771 [Caerostris extrusa]|uniref:Uncharacterized protein n=1 Tax=Caerostris extrusa TaxID=172846 RepID=A0AAV4VJ95_CAEEX|nr:hypothetical protein CEXT_476771 [Caerostris extrusa]
MRGLCPSGSGDPLATPSPSGHIIKLPIPMMTAPTGHLPADRPRLTLSEHEIVRLLCFRRCSSFHFQNFVQCISYYTTPEKSIGSFASCLQPIPLTSFKV